MQKVYRNYLIIFSYCYTTLWYIILRTDIFSDDCYWILWYTIMILLIFMISILWWLSKCQNNIFLYKNYFGLIHVYWIMYTFRKYAILISYTYTLEYQWLWNCDVRDNMHCISQKSCSCTSFLPDQSCILQIFYYFVLSRLWSALYFMTRMKTIIFNRHFCI